MTGDEAADILSNLRLAQRMKSVSKDEIDAVEFAVNRLRMDTVRDLEILNNIVWEEDIPSSTVPEYVEHHQSCQRIMSCISDLIKKYKQN